VQTTDAQVRKLMEEMRKHGEVGRAAAKADMDRKTARKYIREGKLPSGLAQPRTWRTRKNPFSSEDWATIAARLEETPELEAKTLFEWLAERRLDAYTSGQLRTLQRHVKRWRAAHGPDKEVFFAQRHRAGEAAQTDFTSATELAVTIGGQVFAHMLCVVVLPYSNWQWATVCLSESIMATRRPGCGLSARTRSDVSSNRQFDCGDTSNPEGAARTALGTKAAVQRRVSRAHAPLRHDAADDGNREERAKR